MSWSERSTTGRSVPIAGAVASLALSVGLCCNAVNASVLSQVALSFVLPLPMIALVVLSSRKSIMGDNASRRPVIAAATVVIVLLNVVLIGELLL